MGILKLFRLKAIQSRKYLKENAPKQEDIRSKITIKLPKDLR
jgi:hypothetical protein